MKIILIIDTSSNKQIAVGLMINRSQYWIKRKIKAQKAQVTLPLIDKLLEKHGLKLNDIESIKLSKGHGSFTGMRVGMAIANALGFVLNIPVKTVK